MRPGFVGVQPGVLTCDSDQSLRHIDPDNDSVPINYYRRTRIHWHTQHRRVEFPVFL